MAYGQDIPSVPQELPKNLFRYGEQTIWSSQFHRGGSVVANNTFRLFTTPQGQVGQGFTLPLTIEVTSVKEGGRIPAAIAYDVFGIAVQVLHSTNAEDGAFLNAPADTQAEISDLLTVLNNAVISWDFTQTTVQVAPAMLIGAGGGAFGAVGTAVVGATIGHMNNGAGGCFLYRKHPVALPGQTTFAIILQYGSRAPAIGQTAIAVRCVLAGYYKNIIEIG